MPTLTKRRRATVSDDGKAKVRRIFRDAEEAALEALGGSGMGGTPDMDDEADEGGEGNHTHIHIHGSGDPAPAKPAADAIDPAAGGDPSADPGTMTQDDPTEQRFAAIEGALAALTEAVNKLAGGTPAPTTPAADSHGDPTKISPGETTQAMPEELKADDAMPEELVEAMKSKTGDSIALETSFRAVVADAEILVPGFRIPTFDSKVPRKATLDSMCQLRRAVISNLNLTTDGCSLLATANGGAAPGDLGKASCVAVATLFRAAAGAKRTANQRMVTGDNGRFANGFPKPQVSAVKAPRTLAEMNEANRKFHEGKGR